LENKESRGWTIDGDEIPPLWEGGKKGGKRVGQPKTHFFGEREALNNHVTDGKGRGQTSMNKKKKTKPTAEDVPKLLKRGGIRNVTVGGII